MRSSIRPSRRPEKSTREPRLHIAAAISDDGDVHILPDYAVDRSIGFEEELAILPDPECQQFIGIGAAVIDREIVVYRWYSGGDP